MTTQTTTNIARMSLDTLRAALRSGGYAHLEDRAAEISAAAKAGCLLWSATRLTTTDASRIDERPRTR